jgi:transposase
LEKNLAKQEEQLKKEMRQLGGVAFGCVHDAEVEVEKLQKEYPLYHVHGQVVAEKKYAGKGKPAADAVPLRIEYHLDLMVERDEAAVAELLSRKGRFILATNDMDAQAYPAARMLSEYKEQQHVEGGFRFLKDPWFMVDSVFLKSPQRVAALMVVMTLCLLVYNIAQYKLRSRLKQTGETLPNQLDKQVQNPTLRWIFQIMEGLGVVRIQEKPEGPPRELLTNMSPLRMKIIQLFGPTACRMHGLNPESAL